MADRRLQTSRRGVLEMRLGKWSLILVEVSGSFPPFVHVQAPRVYLECNGLG